MSTQVQTLAVRLGLTNDRDDTVHVLQRLGGLSSLQSSEVGAQ